ncbi:hypothetical protein ACT413_08680 [Acinetobacter baumannii]
MMDFYDIAFDEDYESYKINSENITVELSVFQSLWGAWEKFVEIFYFQLYMENKEKKINEDEIKKLLIKLFWNSVHSHLLGDEYLGDQKREQFFHDALGQNENTQETLDFCLMHVIEIVCKYACDAYLHYCDKPNDMGYLYFLNEANYFRGLLVASHADKMTGKQELKDKMVDLANKRHAEKRKKDNKNLQEVKKIWDGSNWKSYTECANEIHRNQLIEEENYRKIYDLVSKAAKIKK